jgi:hypothetical protein
MIPLEVTSAMSKVSRMSREHAPYANPINAFRASGMSCCAQGTSDVSLKAAGHS